MVSPETFRSTYIQNLDFFLLAKSFRKALFKKSKSSLPESASNRTWVVGRSKKCFYFFFSFFEFSTTLADIAIGIDDVIPMAFSQVYMAEW